MKILVADDDKEIVELISIYLHNEGYEAVKAYDGKEAMEYVRSTPDIGLLILDIMMPELDGMQVVKALRKESQIPIIMLTAKTTDMDKIKGLVAGADDYITKPFSMDELFARVQAHLRREKRSSHKSRGHFTRELIIDYSQRTVIIKNKKIDCGPLVTNMKYKLDDNSYVEPTKEDKSIKVDVKNYKSIDVCYKTKDTDYKCLK